ncbi:ribosome assembly RNA-binding protein YhbY [Magnetococcus sp. PR-3]|uniref:ribosome assembly RNA-binding protein YhbY n=1 Tax=Magnetococcus sp. PR-3 TaxID=3120355 RepID=UPI002FCE236B
MSLAGFQRKHLKGLAHSLKPVVFVGKEGVTESVQAAIEEALLIHELIKVRFLDFKEQRKDLAKDLAKDSKSEFVGMIGHLAILYRMHPEPEHRRIQLPKKKKKKDN